MIKINIKKILLIGIILLSFISCSNNSYVKNMERGYWTDKTDKTLYVKDSTEYTYTKRKMKYKVYDNQHYLVLRENKTTGEKSLYLALKYRGDNWVYMKALDLIGNQTYHIDFMGRKMSSALWKDKSNMVDSVEEYIAFKLKPEEIVKLKEILSSNTSLNIKYYGELDNESELKEIDQKELENMKAIIELF